MFFSGDFLSRAARTLILCLMNDDYRIRGNYHTILNSEWMKDYNKWLVSDQHFTYEVVWSN